MSKHGKNGAGEVHITGIDKIAADKIGSYISGTSGGGGSVGASDSTYSNTSGDFTVTVNNGTKTITIAGLPYTLTDEILQSGSLTVNGEAVSLAGATFTGTDPYVITVPELENNLTASDVVAISLPGPTKAYDDTLDVLKNTRQNTEWDRYTCSEELVNASDIGATDDTWVDQGAEIDCQGYKTLAIYVNFTVNDSTGNQLQVLSKHESAGSDEYVIETAADYQKTIGDASVKVVYFFNVEGIPFVQIQTKATDVDTGGGTEGTVTIDIVREY